MQEIKPLVKEHIWLANFSYQCIGTKSRGYFVTLMMIQPRNTVKIVMTRFAGIILLLAHLLFLSLICKRKKAMSGVIWVAMYYFCILTKLLSYAPLNFRVARLIASISLLTVKAHANLIETQQIYHKFLLMNIFSSFVQAFSVLTLQIKLCSSFCWTGITSIFFLENYYSEFNFQYVLSLINQDFKIVKQVVCIIRNKGNKLVIGNQYNIYLILIRI